jgi:hypothetical protein
LTTQHEFALQTGSLSLLTKNFNILWGNGLNVRADGFTHWLMLHADITPEDGFLDKMINTMEERQADVLSVVSPIKTSKGLTSTALDVDGKWRVKPLSMKDIFDREETFTEENLLINTGLMLVDFRKPWVEKIHFRMEDDIIMHEGKWTAVSMSEDWLFSRDAKALGAKIFATRAIKILHHGNAAYTNAQVWGQRESDA